ncbi:MAG: cobalamin-dependent protein [Proteobacteria bacterium]|nr:cobalamin-dependent protein [Pseudomonadota bacterium]
MDPTQQKTASHFQETFLKFDIDAIPACAQQMIDSQMGIQDFLDACMPLMETIGKRYESGEYYLPELVAAGEMFKTASAIFNNQIKGDKAVLREKLGKIVLGTPKGDIHNLGKDIFGVLAEANGFEVHDLGIDVPPEKFIEAIEQTQATVLGMSSLLTTAFEHMKDVVNRLEKKGLRQNVFVIIGGGATEQSLVEKLCVDSQTRDAYEGIKLIKNFIQNKKESKPCRKHA